jgi:hypothetical protein
MLLLVGGIYSRHRDVMSRGCGVTPLQLLFSVMLSYRRDADVHLGVMPMFISA